MIYCKKKSLIKKIKSILKNKGETSLNSSSFIRGFFVFLFLLFLSVYSVYLFLAPKYINEENVQKVINNYILKNSKLVFETDNFSLKTDYKFNINLRADYFKLDYPDKKNFIFIKKPDLNANIFSLLLGYVDLDKIRTDKITINTKFNKDDKYDCFNYFEIKSKNENSKLKLRNINLFVKTFEFNLLDENINKNFKADFSNLKISNDFKRTISIVSKGEISSSNHKISDLSLNLSIKINPNAKERFIDKLSKLNYNPLKDADKYKFYSEADVNLKINPLDKKNNITGLVNLKNYTFSIKDVNLPKNNLFLKFKDNKIITNFDFKFIKNQNIKVDSVFSLKNKFIQAYLKSSEINLSDLNDILNVINEIFNLKLKTNEIMLSGLLDVNMYLKSDFKTISSNGRMMLQNGVIKHNKTGLVLKEINSNIDFQNNNINIINASAFINDAKFSAKGTIDSKANLNLKVNSSDLNVAQVLTLINEIPFLNVINPHLKNYEFKKGFLKINTNIKGKLQNPIIETNSQVTNLDIYNKIDNYNFSSEKIIFLANPDNKKIGNISAVAQNAKILFQNKTVKIPNLKLNILENNIEILNTNAEIEKTSLSFSGLIKNYKTQPLINLFLIINSLNNELFYIKDNPKLKANLICKQDKIIISDAYLYNTSNINLAQLSAIIAKSSNGFKIENAKVDFFEKIKIVIPNLNNSTFELFGNLIATGNLENPDIAAKFNLSNLSFNNIGLVSDNALLNIKNSQFYLTIPKAKMKDIEFDLMSNFEYKNTALTVNLLKFSSNYVNIQNLQNFSSNQGSFNSLNFEIKKIMGNILTLENPDFLLNSISFEGNLKNNDLDISSFSADYLNGKILGEFKTNLIKKNIKTNIKLKELNIRLLPSKLKEILIAESGKLNADIKLKSNNQNINDILLDSEVDIYFTIENGELSQFAKLERFLQAGNILSQSILKLSLNSALSVINKQNSGDFKLIEGKAHIQHQNADIEYIKSQGSNMSLYLDGKFNMQNQYFKGKVLGRIPLTTVNVLGNFGEFSIDKKIKATNPTAIEKKFSVDIPNDEIEKIPELAYNASVSQTREFVVNIDGFIKNLNSIRDFKWGIKN